MNLMLFFSDLFSIMPARVAETKSGKYRGFAITVNVEADFERSLQYFKDQESRLTCGVAADEVGDETKHRHLQCFLMFKNQVKLNTVRGALCPAETQPIKKSPQCNWDYCHKDGKVLWSFGTPPKGSGSRTDLEAVHADLKSGKSMAVISDTHFEAFAK